MNPPARCLKLAVMFQACRWAKGSIADPYITTQEVLAERHPNACMDALVELESTGLPPSCGGQRRVAASAHQRRPPRVEKHRLHSERSPPAALPTTQATQGLSPSPVFMA